MTDGSEPYLPGGDGRAANFHQKVHKKVFGPSTKLRNSSTVRVDRRHNGIFLRVKRRKSQGGSGGMNYRGTYNTILTYNPSDVVRVQTGDSQGVWIRVGSGATTGSDPVWPEPATTGGSNVWELLAFGVQTSSVCISGTTKTQYINATAAS